MKKIFIIIVAIMIAVACLTGCTEAANVNHNLSQAADNFKCLRKITVYNARTDLIVMEMEGYMSLSNTGTVTDPFHYKVHFYTALPDVDINH